jgi:DedD protein
MSDTPQTPETVQFKKRARRRLMGAIVIVSILVILLPMVLDRDPEPVSPDLDITIPSQEAPGFGTAPPAQTPPAPLPPIGGQAVTPQPAPPGPLALQPMPEPAPPAAEPPAELPEPPVLVPKPKETPPAKPEKPKTEPQLALSKPPGTEPVKSAPPPKPEPKPEAKPPAAEKPPPPPSPVREGYAVQVASFSTARTAHDMEQKIATLGLRTYTDNVGGAWRVRVGPFPSVELADAARGRLILGGFDGVVVSAK